MTRPRPTLRRTDFSSSAKTALNVNDIFLAIAKKLPKDGEGGAGAGSGGTRLTQGGGAEGSKMGSCCNK